MGRPAAFVAAGVQGGVLAIPGEGGLITVGDGIGLSAMLGTGATTMGLTPPLPISKEPNGIPARAAPPGVVGDVAAADEALLLAVVPQGPDIVALPGSNDPVPMPVPPPSKVVVEPDIEDDTLPAVVQGKGLSPGDAS